MREPARLVYRFSAAIRWTHLHDFWAVQRVHNGRLVCDFDGTHDERSIYLKVMAVRKVGTDHTLYSLIDCFFSASLSAPIRINFPSFQVRQTRLGTISGTKIVFIMTFFLWDFHMRKPIGHTGKRV